MLFYAHSGVNNGAANWSVQAKAGDQGAVYAIRENGVMLFYKHGGVSDGSDSWPIQAKVIGTGWNFRQVFAGDEGAVYAIRENGDMLFYRHTGYRDGSAEWPIQARPVGRRRRLAPVGTFAKSWRVGDGNNRLFSITLPAKAERHHQRGRIATRGRGSHSSRRERLSGH
jgi:hypothetical protein